MSKQTKQLREAISLVLQAQSEELKEGAGAKAKASELNEKIDSILNRVFMERSREIIQKLNESELANDETEINDEETDGSKEILAELDRLNLDEIEDIEDAAPMDGDEPPADDADLDAGDDLGDEPPMDDAEASVEDPEADDIDFDDIDFGGDEEGGELDAGDEDADLPSDDEEEINDEEIA